MNKISAIAFRLLTIDTIIMKLIGKNEILMAIAFSIILVGLIAAIIKEITKNIKNKENGWESFE